ncbi:MAG: SDR family oxidoreductase [Solirubrobacterales bacterium]|nr:SDR family oxidoreductase [Solirubrobacterales bacterium]
MDLGLQGRRALVTGGTRGIGLAVARRLHEEGCAVAVCARDGDEAERVGAQLGGFGMAVDVTDDAALEGFVATAAQRLGGLDAVVANAGGSAGGGALGDAPGDDWRATFDLNVVHAAVLLRAAAPHLAGDGGGAALVVASVSGMRPQPRAQYAAAKAAEIHLAASLGRELAPTGVRVNALSPGSILTPDGWAVVERDRPGDFAAFVAAEFPHGRLGTPEEVADVAAFLLSPRASWINATNIVVDGAQNQPTITGY